MSGMCLGATWVCVEELEMIPANAKPKHRTRGTERESTLGTLP